MRSAEWISAGGGPSERCTLKLNHYQASSDLDTRLAVLITGVGTASGLVASHLVVDDQLRLALFAFSATSVALTLGFALNGLRPRTTSFGIDPGAISAMADAASNDFSRRVRNGLVEVYRANKGELEAKAAGFRRALFTFFVALISIGPLIAAKAVQ